MSVTRQVRAFVLFLLLSLSALLMIGCTAQVDVRGSAPSDEDLATVRRGVDTKQDIQERFGFRSRSVPQIRTFGTTSNKTCAPCRSARLMLLGSALL